MKLKNTLISLLSMAAAAFAFSACTVEDAVEFPEIASSQAVYQAPAEGGEVTIALTSNVSWTASVAPATSRDNIDDVKLAVEKGDASTKELKVTFGANAGYNRGAIITLTGRDVSTAVKVEQTGAKGELIESITIQEFLDKPVDASIYYQISGTVTKITQGNKFSNFYLNDGTAEVYVYGLWDGKGGPQFTDGWIDNHGVTVGYTMTIGATRGQYNATIEATNAYPIEWAAPTTPMINVEAAAVSVGASATEAKFAVTAMNLKSDWTVTPKESYSWVKDYTKSGRASGDIVITLEANEDTENARTAVFTLANADCESVELTLTQAKKLTAGTLETPFTVTQAIEAAKAGVSGSVYVKGIVSELYKGGFDANYGNGSFYMSEDGVRHNDNALDFEAYQVFYLEGKKWTAEDAQMEIGAEVVIYGPLTIYNGLVETQGKGAAYVYSLNGVTTAAEGVGLQAKPFTVAGAIEAAKAGVSGSVYVKGIVSELYKGGFDANYGNGSFYMSEDGVRHNDNSLDFEAYQVNYLENKKWTAEDPQIAVGDKAVVYGPLTIYNGLVETQGKSAGYLYSLNGKTSAEAPATGVDLSGTEWRLDYGVLDPDQKGYFLEFKFTDATTVLMGEGDPEDGFWEEEAAEGTYTFDGKNLVCTFDEETVIEGTIEDDVLTIALYTEEYGEDAVFKKYTGEDDDTPGEDPEPSVSEYESNVKDAIVTVASAYIDGVATVNGIEDVFTLKFGSSKANGEAKITLPAGTSRLSFYAVGWKGTSASIAFTAEGVEASQNVAANDGASGSAPYTMTVTNSDKYTLTLTETLAEALELTVKSTGRVIMFGIKAQ